MKYWAYFAGKLTAIGLLLAALWFGARLVVPRAEHAFVDERLNYDMKNVTLAYGFCLLAAGLLYAAVWDQRYRCRTCLRRLRMPVERGDWGRTLLVGRPHMEYICTYGHGTLKVPELQFAGKEPNDWDQHQDMWKELETPRR